MFKKIALGTALVCAPFLSNGQSNEKKSAEKSAEKSSVKITAKVESNASLINGIVSGNNKSAWLGVGTKLLGAKGPKISLNGQYLNENKPELVPFVKLHQKIGNKESVVKGNLIGLYIDSSDPDKPESLALAGNIKYSLGTLEAGHRNFLGENAVSWFGGSIAKKFGEKEKAFSGSLRVLNMIDKNGHHQSVIGQLKASKNCPSHWEFFALGQIQKPKKNDWNTRLSFGVSKKFNLHVNEK